MFQVNLVMDDETGEDMDSRKERQALEDAANAARQALEDVERSFQVISEQQLTGLIEDGGDIAEYLAARQRAPIELAILRHAATKAMLDLVEFDLLQAMGVMMLAKRDAQQAEEIERDAAKKLQYARAVWSRCNSRVQMLGERQKTLVEAEAREKRQIAAVATERTNTLRPRP